MTAARRRRLGALARLLVTAGLLWLVVRAVGVEAIADTLARAAPGALAAAGVVLLVQFLAMAWRWQLLLRTLFGRRIGLRPLALSIGQGMLASQALPATIGGDAYRIALVADRAGVAAALRSVLCDRVVALGLLVALVVALLPWMIGRLGTGTAVLTVAAASIAALVAFVAFLVLAPRIERLPVLGTTLGTAAVDARRALVSGRDAYLASALGLAIHLLAVLLVYLLALAVRSPLPLADCLVIVPPALLVSALPISLGGWGVREGAFLAGFAMVGAAPAAGVTVSVLFGATGVLLGIACALLAPVLDRADRAREEAS